MTTLAVIMFLSLAGVAALHVAWGLGVLWPLEDERDLVALVVGETGRSRMPPLNQCLLAAIVIFSAGLIALAAADLLHIAVAPDLVTAAGALAALVFAGRGIAPYLPAWRRAFSQEPFATLDRSWYGPFCLLLATAYTVMAVIRFWQLP
jgi:hypothetical protein